MVVRVTPSLLLSKYVHAYHYTDFYFSHLLVQSFAASPSFWIGFPLGDPMKYETKFGVRMQLKEPYLFAGNFDAKYMHVKGHLNLLVIELTIDGVYQLLGIPGHLIANQIIPLSDCMAASAFAELYEKLHAPCDRLKKISFAESWLMSQILPEKYDTQIANYAYWKIQSTKGRNSIADIAQEMGISEVYLRKKFKEVAGVSPKFISRIVKITHVCREIKQNRPDWQTIVDLFQYHDQAHLIKEFKLFTGYTPKLFFADGSEVYREQL